MASATARLRIIRHASGGGPGAGPGAFAALASRGSSCRPGGSLDAARFLSECHDSVCRRFNSLARRQVKHYSFAVPVAGDAHVAGRDQQWAIKPAGINETKGILYHLSLPTHPMS